MSENNKNAASKLFNKIVMRIHNLNSPESDISMEGQEGEHEHLPSFVKSLLKLR